MNDQSINLEKNHSPIIGGHTPKTEDEFIEIMNVHHKLKAGCLTLDQLEAMKDWGVQLRVVLGNSRLIDRRMTCNGDIFKVAVEFLVKELKLEWMYHPRDRNFTFLLQELVRQYKLDPTSFVSYPRGSNKWTKHPIRNPVGHTDGIIDIIDAMRKAGYLEGKKGFQGVVSSFISRTRPTSKFLTKILPLIDIDELRLRPHKNSQYIVLRDADKNVTNGKMSQAIQRRERLLQRYNELMLGWIVTLSEDRTYPDVHWSQRDPDQRYSHCVFNNSSFKQGGRLYGPWYLHINREYRPYLMINGIKTKELDYNALHIRLLLEKAKTKINTDDPYSIPGFDRNIVKYILLIAINAESHVEAYYAYLKEKGIKDTKVNRLEFDAVIKGFKEYYPSIANKICSGQGVFLQFRDSKIAEHVIRHFVSKKLPILCIHDSFIVEEHHAPLLHDVMIEAFEKFGGMLNAPVIK